jgi:hypothetical protein
LAGPLSSKPLGIHGRRMKRRDEEHSRHSLEAWLASESSDVQVTWHEVPQALEPPDWFLDIADRRLAVEATSIVEDLSAFDPPLSTLAVSASLASFIERLERDAKATGPLNGVYIVTLAPMPNLGEHEEWLFRELSRYIDRTRDDRSAERHSLGRLGMQDLSITKVESDAEYVAELIFFGTKTGDEAFADLLRVLAHVLTKKASKLARITDPVVLLMLDAFAYSEAVDWEMAIAEIPARVEFEAIFRTRPDRKAQLLYAKESW